MLELFFPPKSQNRLVTSCDLHLKQALALGESSALHGPEVDVGFSTGDNQIVVHWMKHGRQHRVVGALWEQALFKIFPINVRADFSEPDVGTFTSATCFSFCQSQTDKM